MPKDANLGYRKAQALSGLFNGKKLDADLAACLGCHRAS